MCFFVNLETPHGLSSIWTDIQINKLSQSTFATISGYFLSLDDDDHHHHHHDRYRDKWNTSDCPINGEHYNISILMDLIYSEHSVFLEQLTQFARFFTILWSACSQIQFDLMKMIRNGAEKFTFAGPFGVHVQLPQQLLI